MNPAPIGTRIRVLAGQGNHSYTVGQIYRIVQDDKDGTFKAADASGRVGNWLRWELCEPVGPSIWERIAGDLPDDLRAFLSCFDGIGDVELEERVVDAVLEDVPDLHERLVAFARTPGGMSLVAGNLPAAAATAPPSRSS
jgi:hypothetical protein